MRSRTLLHSTLAATFLLGGIATALPAQTAETGEWLEECRNNQNWSRGRAMERHCEVREFTLAAGQPLRVDGSPNGGIRVQSWDRNEIRVQALVSANARSAADARADAEAIELRTDGHSVRASGPNNRRDEGGWSVSYRVYVPAQADLDLSTVNGGLRVENVSGRIVLATSNGGIRLEGVSGDVRGRTSNGALNVTLGGQRWQGSGLDLQTSNGAITLHVPDGYSAQLETGTVNGRINTEIPITVQGDMRRNLSAQLGQGGAPIRITTTNGAVRIRRI